MPKAKPVEIPLRGGYATTDPRLDRVPFYDPRSLLYPIRPVVEAKAEGRGPRSFSWRWVTLDQDNEGACTGFSATTEAAARPSPVFGDPVAAPPAIGGLNDIARNVYHRARQLDEWEGEDYEGSSVLAATKAGVEQGWWSEYRWALGPGADVAANDVIMALGYHGPVCMASWWWSGMDEADEDGFLHPTGHKRGGHAFCLTRYSKTLGAVWTPNSWGGAGQGWISRDDLAALLADEGEAMIPVTRRVPRPAGPTGYAPVRTV